MKGLNRMKTTWCAVLATAVFLVSLPSSAQVPVDEDGNPIGNYDVQIGEPDNVPADEMLSEAELQELVGPVALYPDDLLAIVLPASTYPLEIVQAARFLEQLETDSSLEPDESWDDSVVALLNYPDVVRMMDEEIDWTWRLGEAVLSQQNDVIAAVEAFRDRAYAAGNLKTDEYQEVSYDDDGVLEIVPVSEEIIYVPYYEPAEVVVYQPRRVYYYYPDPYPVYYYPYPSGYRFRSGFFWGVTTAFSIGWSNHYLHVYHPSYWGHPYYGRYYYGHYYRRPSITIYNNWYVNNSYRTPRYRYRDGDYWRPRYRAGSRPVETRVRNYHYAPNGSHSSRDYTSSRRTRVSVRNDGRMDLQLRERDRSRTPVASNQGNRGTRSITGSRPADNSRTATSRRNSGQVTDRNTAAATRSGNRVTSTNNSRRETAVHNRTTNPATTGNRGSNRVNTASRSSSAGIANRATSRRNTTDRVPTARSAPPRVRQEAPARRSTPPSRSSSASAPRRSASVPRASAPRSAPAAAPRASSAPRSSARSGSTVRSSSGSARRSGANRSRVRQNNRN